MDNKHDILDNGPFFHGTKAELKIGDYSERKFGAYLGTEKDLKPPVINVKEIRAGKYLCALHRGGYTEIWQHVLVLRDEYRNLELEDWSVHFNIIDQFVEKNPDHYLTKIQIPIKT